MNSKLFLVQVAVEERLSSHLSAFDDALHDVIPVLHCPSCLDRRDPHEHLACVAAYPLRQVERACIEVMGRGFVQAQKDKSH
jgi:hypothetical protein